MYSKIGIDRYVSLKIGPKNRLAYSFLLIFKIT